MSNTDMLCQDGRNSFTILGVVELDVLARSSLGRLRNSMHVSLALVRNVQLLAAGMPHDIWAALLF